jgi:hypothetical protein
VSDSLGGVRPSLNWMAASNINSDAAIRSNFSGSVFRVCTYGNNVVFIFHIFSLISVLLVLLFQVFSDSVASLHLPGSPLCQAATNCWGGLLGR